MQEDSSCLAHTQTHECSIAPKSSDYPERNLISTPLRSIASTFDQHIRAVLSSERLLGALLKLSMRRVCEKSCGHHLIQRVV